MEFIFKMQGPSPETHTLRMERNRILKLHKLRIVRKGRKKERIHEYRPYQQGRKRME